MIEFYTRMMKPINGHCIDKSAEINSRTGKIKKETIIYTVYDADEDGFYNCFKTLKEAQEFARNI